MKMFIQLCAHFLIIYILDTFPCALFVQRILLCLFLCIVSKWSVKFEKGLLSTHNSTGIGLQSVNDLNQYHSWLPDLPTNW